MMPAPITVPESTRNMRLPSLSAVHPRAAIASMEAAAPTKRASPSGPGERPREALRSAKSTAKIPAKPPKEPKAPRRTGRTILPGRGTRCAEPGNTPPASTNSLGLSVLGPHGEGTVRERTDLVVSEEDRVRRDQAEEEPQREGPDLAFSVRVGPHLHYVPQGPHVPREDHRSLGLVG